MDRLPIEILTKILQLMDIKTLKMTRLVNKGISGLSARYLYKSIYIRFLPNYLDKLHKVALHPVLRYYVRTIYVDDHLIKEDYRSFGHWVAGLDLCKENGEYCTETGDRGHVYDCARHEAIPRFVGYCRLYLRQCYGLFEEIYFRQEKLFKHGTGMGILSIAFSLLPNLQSIATLDDPVHRGTLLCRHHPFERAMHDWSSVVSLPQRDLLGISRIPHPFPLGRRLDEEESARPFISLLLAL